MKSIVDQTKDCYEIDKKLAAVFSFEACYLFIPSEWAGTNNINPSVLFEVRNLTSQCLKHNYCLPWVARDLPIDWLRANICPMCKKVAKWSQNTTER